MVRQLQAALAALRQQDPAEYRALFEVRHPHRVPAYLYGHARCVRLISARDASPSGGWAAKGERQSGFCESIIRAYRWCCWMTQPKRASLRNMAAMSHSPLARRKSPARSHEIDVVVKSPGVSLYRDDIRSARKNGVQITSLLNLWFAEEPNLTTIAVTGTKGKEHDGDRSSRISLTRLGRRVALAGNIGVPVTEISNAEYAVIEVSSYQAADFDGVCDLGVLTSLYPEHADWHLTVERYVRDKVNLLVRSRCRIVNVTASDAVDQVITGSPGRKYLFNEESGIHSQGTEIFDGRDWIGNVCNPYLVRAHNRSNLCAALAVAKILDLDLAAALDATRDFLRTAAPAARARRKQRHPFRRRQHFDDAQIDDRSLGGLCRSRCHGDRGRLRSRYRLRQACRGANEWCGQGRHLHWRYGVSNLCPNARGAGANGWFGQRDISGAIPWKMPSHVRCGLRRRAGWSCCRPRPPATDNIATTSREGATSPPRRG